jgi:hypothetical protein
MNEIVGFEKSAYKKANAPEFPKNILDFSTMELKALLITEDGIGKKDKAVILQELLRIYFIGV